MQTSKDTVIPIAAVDVCGHAALIQRSSACTIVRTRHPILGRMRRYMIWFILAIFWGAIALVGQFRHHPGNAALEGAVAVLFIVIGVAVKRRDAAAAARYTANRPK
jgi:hypothetical protein